MCIAFSQVLISGKYLSILKKIQKYSQSHGFFVGVLTVYTILGFVSFLLHYILEFIY